MQIIDRNELKQKIKNKEDFEIIDVLPPDSYKDYHLPGARNIPVQDKNFEKNVQETVPDKEKDVVVYCKDTDCGASPKAAKKMEALGYKNVYDYEAGKEDWKQAGMDVES